MSADDTVKHSELIRHHAATVASPCKTVSRQTMRTAAGVRTITFVSIPQYARPMEYCWDVDRVVEWLGGYLKDAAWKPYMRKRIKRLLAEKAEKSPGAMCSQVEQWARSIVAAIPFN